MPDCPWPLFLRRVTLAELEGFSLEPKHHWKTVRGWLGAGCASWVICLCLVCLYLLPGRVFAQDSSSGASAAKTTSTKTVTAKSPTKSATSGSEANAGAPAKASAASHPSTVKHTNSKTSPAAHSGKAKYVSSRKNGKKKPRGQQKIDSERAQAIQEALIREHYMTGEATGTWNQASEDAMRRYQADHGWQSKEVPDSRALISLGLGPSNDHLLNPESAMTTGPGISHAAAPVSTSSADPVSHGAEPGARMNTSSPLPSNSPNSDSAGPQ
jgi:hypothetical protein